MAARNALVVSLLVSRLECNGGIWNHLQLFLLLLCEMISFWV